MDRLEGSTQLASDKGKWNNFKQQMKELFELSELDIQNPESYRLSDIKQETFAMCSDSKYSDKRVPLPTDLAQSLRSVTNNLMSQQKSHVERAFLIIFQIFDKNELQAKRRLTFDKQLYTQGISRVEEISNSAITLLTAYYKNCETTYQDGVRMIYSRNKQKPLIGSTAT
jgi:hypothetical protein